MKKARRSARAGIPAPHLVPPSPDVMAMLFMDYRRSGKSKSLSFGEYLQSIGFVDPAAAHVGMDDRARFLSTTAGPELITAPTRPVVGEVRVKVLLVDFPDRPGVLPKSHYEDLLFSDGVFPTGSMRDFYREVSLGKVQVTGSVHGWLRMPQPYSYYTNGNSGTKWADYPHNAPRLAEDAVKAAKQAGVPFEASLDKFGEGIVTALFLVHSGRGAETLHPSISGSEIWSHKWQLRTPVDVGSGLAATIYLTVPNDCKVGVCAHELGHLAFQWQDFYDPDYAKNGEWDGSGVWDLMAGGSYNGSGARPAHPAGLHKLQHGWITATTLKKSGTVTLRPYSPTAGRVVRIESPAFDKGQYLLLENRQRNGFDFHLPGEGLLVWRIDEKGEQETPNAPGLFLVQADGRNDLSNPKDWNQGDAGDPFPGSANVVTLRDVGEPSTSFPGKRSGITLRKITRDAAGVIRLQVQIAASAGGPPKAKPKAPASGPKAAAKPTPAARRSAPTPRRPGRQRESEAQS